MTTCSDCDSPQNYCSGPGSCHNYCLKLVGEIGFCMPACGCCVCPEVSPSGPGLPLPEACQRVCRCGASYELHPEGCPPGCTQVNCQP